MQLALTLLISAQTLLAMVLGNPALPQDFKDNAINIANNAITVAQEEIAKQNQPVQQAQPIVVQQTPLQTQTLTTPSFGSTISVMPTEIKVTTIKTAEGGQEHMPFGQYNFIVSVLDQNGNYLKDQTVTMDSPDNLLKGIPEDFTKTTSRTSGLDNQGKMTTDWKTGDFNYIPAKKGTITITFTSGSLVNNYQLEVK